MQSTLSLCLYVPEGIASRLAEILHGDRFQQLSFHNLEEFREFLESHPEHIDCLIVFSASDSLPVLNQLYEQGCLLPTILLDPHPSAAPEMESDAEVKPTILYHNAEVHLPESKWETLPTVIDKAITDYLHLGPSCALPAIHAEKIALTEQESQQSFLLLQQRRLADKLKERLGYLGVYYKRNPSQFYRNFSPQEKQEFLALIGTSYQDIILDYFNEEVDVNDMLDQFVNQVFFADVPISQILEIHMELMDELSQQLRLEGRSEEILLDYRLVLIDILAHLGEMYRRSIPREDIPFDVYFHGA